ncbi:P-loop NTPase family protein [Bounagaea algeriensis]
MEIIAEGVEVVGAHGPLLAPTSLRVRDGEPLLITGEDATARTALALALSGRIKPTRGTVRLGGALDARALRRRTGIVDAPGITAPEQAVSVRQVTAEGLSLAGRKSGRRAVRARLAEHGLSGHAEQRFENLPAAHRTRLLAELARTGSGTRALLFDAPDRHGGPPEHWHELARETAAHGLATAVLCSPHSAEKLDAPTALLGADNRTTTPSTSETAEGTE